MLFTVLFSGSFSPTWEQYVSEAADHYTNGNYAEAIVCYEHLISRGIHNAPLYHNLGNAYLLNNEPGQAILNYERALMLNPRQIETRKNLMEALSRAGVSSSIPPPGKWPHTLFFWHTDIPDHMLRIVWLTFWCLFWTALTCTVVLHSRKFVFFCVVSGLCTAFIGASVYVKKAESNVAVAVVSDIPVHYGPYSEAAVRTTLRSGERMRIVRTLDDWMLLSLPGGVQGWSIHEGIVPVYLDE